MAEKKFVSLFEKGETKQIIEKKNTVFLGSCIYAAFAIISSFSIYYLRLKDFQLLKQFGYFGNVSEMITVIGFMVLPILIPLLFYSITSSIEKWRMVIGSLIAIVFITRISAIVIYLSEVFDPSQLEFSKPGTLMLITIFVFLLCMAVLLCATMCYAVNNLMLASVLFKVGAIGYIIINAFFLFGYIILSILKIENHLIYSMVVYALDIASSIFLLIFVKKLNNKIGSNYLLNK